MQLAKWPVASHAAPDDQSLLSDSDDSDEFIESGKHTTKVAIEIYSNLVNFEKQNQPPDNEIRRGWSVT